MQKDEEYRLKEANLKKFCLDEAKKDLKEFGRYWNGSISRTMTSILASLLKDEGYSVSYREIAPDWEHVYYRIDNFRPNTMKEIESIAQYRAIQRENGISEHLLKK